MVKKFLFSKMQACGNDFVVLETCTQPDPHLSTNDIIFLAHRHTGIGFDQLLILSPSPHDAVDFLYRIYNRDGSEVYQCTNGIRCVTIFALQKKLTIQHTLFFETANACLQKTDYKDGVVYVDMPIPQFFPECIPCLLTGAVDGVYCVCVKHQNIFFYAVNVGNPHIVITVPVLSAYPVSEIGSALENHAIFPQRVNVSFVEINTRTLIFVRVYERGAGETLACGSGACAAAVCLMKAGLLDRTVCVKMRGGTVHVNWENNTPLLIGGGCLVYDGEIQHPSL